MDPTIAIVAAGASSRMRGGDKLLERVDGMPLLRCLALRALAIGVPVVVTLPVVGERSAVLEDLSIERLPVADAATGMAASFRAIGRAVPDRPVLCMLGDMPEIEVQDLRRLCERFRRDPDRIHRATSEDGRPGQPVVFPARLVPLFTTLKGDGGARGLLRGEDVVSVPLPGARALIDLDTPEEWSDWRARRQSRAEDLS